MRRTRKAFTLVEVLIVVIVLGILAAIVVPQFTDASTDAKGSSLTTNLQIIRGQIALYKLQHDDTYPVLKTFTEQMTQFTKEDGTYHATDRANYPLGPYLQTIPNNPYTGTNDVTKTAAGATKAWYYDEDTGEFRANHQ